MTQHSEERVPDEMASTPTAQIVRFERPQSDLQRAVRERAQEAIDRERDRAAQRRPPTWRRVLVLALAAIPVFLTFGAAIGFVGALRQFNSAVFESQEASSTSTSHQAQAPSAPSVNSEPVVVLLQPYAVPATAQSPSGGASEPR